MDKIAQSANSSRSLRGGDFESRIQKILEDLKQKNKIRGFKRKPKIFDGEFNPDFIIEKRDGNGFILEDCDLCGAMIDDIVKQIKLDFSNA